MEDIGKACGVRLGKIAIFKRLFPLRKTEKTTFGIIVPTLGLRLKTENCHPRPDTEIGG